MPVIAPIKQKNAVGKTHAEPHVPANSVDLIEWPENPRFEYETPEFLEKLLAHCQRAKKTALQEPRAKS